MLSQLIRGGFNASNITFFLSGVFVLISSLSMHEFAHAWAAYRLGDDTARYSGRLTLNPLAHLDPIGTLMMLFLGFGWAKPVPVNTLRFKNQRRGLALTAVAGPAANLLIAFVFMFIIQILDAVGLFGRGTTGEYFFMFFYWIVMRNIMLAVFNLLPVPPLDGSRIMAAVLPDRLYFAYIRYERFFYFILIFLVVSDFTGALLFRLSALIYSLFGFITGLPFGLFG